MSDRGLTHLDPLGRARMVDVTPKEPTHRRATARCKVFMATETTNKIASNAISKGDVLAVARVAGIQASKRTPRLRGSADEWARAKIRNGSRRILQNQRQPGAPGAHRFPRFRRELPFRGFLDSIKLLESNLTFWRGRPFRFLP